MFRLLRLLIVAGIALNVLTFSFNNCNSNLRKFSKVDDNYKIVIKPRQTKLSCEPKFMPDECKKYVVDSKPLVTSLYLLTWVSFVVYAFSFSPISVGPDDDMNIISRIISSPFDGSINPIFVAIFNMLGIYPAIFASILLPSVEKPNKLTSALFIYGSFIAGFFSLGPYLGTREVKFDRSILPDGLGLSFWENKVSSLGMLLFFLGLLYYGLTGGDYPSLSAKWDSFVELFSSVQLVNVSTIDFVVLTLSVS